MDAATTVKANVLTKVILEEIEKFLKSKKLLQNNTFTLVEGSQGFDNEIRSDNFGVELLVGILAKASPSLTSDELSLIKHYAQKFQNEYQDSEEILKLIDL